jgi:opacity protein-like surface antigen
MRSASVCLILLAVCAWPAAAQPQDPVGPFVADARGIMIGLPTTAGWTPPLPADSVVPSRGFGFEGGAHFHFSKWGPARLGVGASVSWARGTAAPLVDTAPEVKTSEATLSPQLSFNFGHRLGWSYLSAGYGAVKVVSESAAITGVPPATADSGWSGAINFGGGARWFVTDHLGVGFDARWHRLSSREASSTTPAASRATLFKLAVGISVQ